MQKEVIRTDVETLFLEEMIDEDANYLINGDNDSDVEAVIPNDYTSTGLFDNSSSDDTTVSDDEDIF